MILRTGEALYQKKEQKYFTGARTEIRNLLPRQCGRILEIGCGDGGTLQWLKKLNVGQWYGGVELVEAQCDFARDHLDFCQCTNIEACSLTLEPASIDLLLCLDVLEHLVDPWNVVRYLKQFLSPNGIVIASIPNIRYYKVLSDLVFKGQWTYRQSGVLDKTHLRFFTLKTARDLFEQAELNVEAIERVGLRKGESRYFRNKITGRLFEDLLTKQYLFKIGFLP